MADQKIKVSLDEVNSSRVDAELHRQDVTQRMAEHQEKIRLNFSGSGEMLGAKTGVFRNSLVYMTIFGTVSSILGWGFAELFMRASNEASSQEEAFGLYWFWYMAFTSIISFGISIAESTVSKNIVASIKNGIGGIILGVIGGALAIFITEPLYHILGGGQALTIQQIFARAVAWSFLGAFVAISPGIIMKSTKKFFLGLAGGAIGGFIGGALFDIICYMFGSDIPARFVNIVGLGVGAAVATAFLENVTKQGWLKVSAGIIAGKQFILYRNPTVIGSSPKCEVYLFKDPSIAPKHAAINNRNGDFLITAINGATVLVNNSPVKQQKLKTGDQIKIGYTTFIFEAKTLKKNTNLK